MATPYPRHLLACVHCFGRPSSQLSCKDVKVSKLNTACTKFRLLKAHCRLYMASTLRFVMKITATYGQAIKHSAIVTNNQIQTASTASLDMLITRTMMHATSTWQLTHPTAYPHPTPAVLASQYPRESGDDRSQPLSRIRGI